ncbi:hypothetical protein KC340_g13434 [Hortaea werneckii]|nr:hypothetical protein KC342_g17640 [Hortaea werneckii]KAI7056141.1 hypothetical protein KC339_g18254 [Hortaea werneckii]KAI7219032.1 hypothetical protein KC365_g12437 [Hortaea werneckii]KAI7300231.1 hypothetical protein KC340_g13434 [Hortaea werneckii]KAI7365480.1 hypothetical protein KC336_g21398 [Hortaea werneckii]
MASPPRPTAATWAMKEMIAWLETLQKRGEERFGQQGSAYIHPAVLTYKDSKAKANYAACNDGKGFREGDSERGHFGEPGTTKKGEGRTVWVFLMDTDNQSYVSQKLSPEDKAEGIQQADKVGMHAWAAAIVAREGNKKGKDMYIMDCDATFEEGVEKVRRGQLQTGKQKTWIDAVEK